MTTQDMKKAQHTAIFGPFTRVAQNPAIHSMRAMALKAFDGLKWRHHGIGVLQGYLSEDSAPEVRLHVWSPRLQKSGIDLSGDAHDHRFDMVSHVLCGSVLHEELTPFYSDVGDHNMLSLTHARAAADTKFHGPTEPIPGRFRVLRHLIEIEAGMTYTFPALSFHRSPMPDANGVAVTVIEKHNQREDVRARILYPTARPPVMAFGHDLDAALIADVLAEARIALATGAKNV